MTNRDPDRPLWREDWCPTLKKWVVRFMSRGEEQQAVHLSLQCARDLAKRVIASDLAHELYEDAHTSGHMPVKHTIAESEVIAL